MEKITPIEKFLQLKNIVERANEDIRQYKIAIENIRHNANLCFFRYLGPDVTNIKYTTKTFKFHKHIIYRVRTAIKVLTHIINGDKEFKMPKIAINNETFDIEFKISERSSDELIDPSDRYLDIKTYHSKKLFTHDRITKNNAKWLLDRYICFNDDFEKILKRFYG